MSDIQLVEPQLLTKLLGLEEFLNSEVLGQTEPLADISWKLSHGFCGVRLHKKPQSMLFLGPTGVGKTETSLLLARWLFGGSGEETFIRLDMSEFMTVGSIDLLRGTGPNDEGLLYRYVQRTKGFGVLLCDEIEKAHKLIIDVLLQILDAGRFTTAGGRTLDLNGFLVIATSNIGSSMLVGSRTKDRDSIVKRVMSVAIQDMRPEIFNRFSLVCVFNKLTDEDLHSIGDLHLNRIVGDLRQRGHQLKLHPTVVDYVFAEGATAEFGARPIEQAALKAIGDAIVPKMLSSGGRPVSGMVCYDRHKHKCYLE
jgi:ATP-dependent Clp protease ATP-binding subunit ClpB